MTLIYIVKIIILNNIQKILVDNIYKKVINKKFNE